MPGSHGAGATKSSGNCAELGKYELIRGAQPILGTMGQGRAGGQAEGRRLTSKGGHRCRLAVAGSQDGGDNVIDEALCDAHLEQGLSHRALGHVDEAGLPERVEQLLYAGEGITVGLVLIDPGRHAELEPSCRKAFGLTTRSCVIARGRPSRDPPSSPRRGGERRLVTLP